ncbi:MAG TPA: hypothetical protein VHX16_17065, partial [Chloroflexota bacterium]|nr:hypothetical protein [Chloroflexota bacterium]
NGRFRAAALIAGLMALPLQASPTFADSCELVSTNGSLDINGLSRSWHINVDGVTYQSDSFDKLTRQTRKHVIRNGKSKTTVKETILTFKDSTDITRTPNNDVGKTVEANIKGEINEDQDTGFVTLKDQSNQRKFRIDDPAHGLPISCA